MSLNNLALGVLRSRGERTLNVLSEAPLPENSADRMNAVRFSSEVRNAVDEIQDVVGEAQPFPNDPIIPQKNFRLNSPHMVQGQSNTIRELLDNPTLPPTWRRQGVHVAIGTMISEPSQDDLEDAREAAGYRRMAVFNCEQATPKESVIEAGNVSYVCLPEKDMRGAIKSVLLSEYLRSCFPFTIWSPDKDKWSEFVGLVSSKFSELSDASEDGFISHFGVPATDTDGIEACWTHAANQLIRKEASVDGIDAGSATEFIVRSWRKFGGTLKKTEVRRKLATNITKLFAGRPGSFDDQTALSALLDGSAELVMTLNRPNPRRRAQVKSLLQLNEFGRHRVGLVPARELDALYQFFEDDTLVKFDARPLRLIYDALSS